MRAKKITNLTIAILILIILSVRETISNDTAFVNINLAEPLKHKISKNIFGFFTEFNRDNINGALGLHAQEILGRSFDLNGKNWIIPLFWDSYNDSLPGIFWDMPTGGFNNKTTVYNPKLKFDPKYCLIRKSDKNGFVGIEQGLFMTPGVAHDFYVYFKGNITGGSVKLSIIDKENGSVYFHSDLGVPDSLWRKVSVEVPPVPSSKKVILRLSFNGVGELNLDESSLMPKDNVYGIRKVYYDLLKKWQFGIWRYPGGCFADAEACHWKYGIGPVDKRNPNLYVGKMVEQRMDFGTDEFLRLTEDLNIEPHFTVNYENGTPIEAAEWVEYCNGDTTTKYGALRAANGRIKPYKVKYWEIGNEQWNDPKAMRYRYLDYYKAMKAVDPSINIIIDGNMWGEYAFFTDLMSVVKNNCQVYGYHPNFSISPDVRMAQDSLFMSLASFGYLLEGRMMNYLDKLKEFNIYPGTKQGITEWWWIYNNIDSTDWLTDSVKRYFSLESAIATASIINACVRQSESLDLAERAFDVGLFLKGINNNGERIIKPGLIYYALMMLSNLTGDFVHPTEVISKRYSIPYQPGIIHGEDIPYLDVASTSTADSMFISIINRNPTDSAYVFLNLEPRIDKARGNKYSLFSNSYLDHITTDEPEKIVPSVEEFVYSKIMKFPPHSLSILTLNKKDFMTDIDSMPDINLSVYPNPFTDFLNISSTWGFNSVNIQLFDILGNSLLAVNQSPFVSDIRLDMRNLPQAAYTIKIIADDKLIIKRLVKIY